MSYSTGVPSSTTNLIASLINFLVSDGGFTLGNTWTFTSANSNPDGGGTFSNYTARALSRDGQYVTLFWKTTSPDYLHLNSCTNNPTSGLPNQQTGAASNSMPIELGTAPLRYHFFSNGNSVNAAVEWLGGVYQHINIGVITKYGAFTGGLYVSGSFWSRNDPNGPNYRNWDTSYHIRPFDGLSSLNTGTNGHVRVDYLGQSVALFSNANLAGNVCVGLQLFSRFMIDRSPNAYNGRAVLAPIEILLGLEDLSIPSHHKPLGRVDNVAYINITNLNPLDVILTDWMVFPLSAKNSGGTVASGYINSGNYGIAYRM